MTDALRLDLHVHSLHSPDSRLSLREITSRLSYTGLRGFALTDHNSVAGHAALAALRADFPAWLFLPGVEVSTREGHLLAYGVREVPPTHQPIAETIEWVEAHGGEAVPAHPFRFSHGIGRRTAEAVRVHALEVRNGHSSEVANAKAELIAARRHLGGTGGSDVHQLLDVGRAFTEFPPDAANTDDLLEAIRRGRTMGGGSSLTWGGRLRLSGRTTLLRLGRGLRPI
jgi:predicted metal-dependent phosphoesterase TrpH